MLFRMIHTERAARAEEKTEVLWRITCQVSYLFLNIAQVCTSSSVSISTLVSSGVRELRILLLSDYAEGKLFKAITVALFLGRQGWLNEDNEIEPGENKKQLNKGMLG